MRLIRTEDAVGHDTDHSGSNERCKISEGPCCHRRRYSGIAFDWERTSVCLGEDRWNAS